MRIAIEIKRGLTACAQWILGAPLANARVAYLAESKQEGRAIMSRHCQRFLNTCHISVEIDGPLPPPGRGCVLCAVLQRIFLSRPDGLYGGVP